MPISTAWFSAKIIVSLTIPEILDSVNLCESLGVSHPELVDGGQVQRTGLDKLCLRQNQVFSYSLISAGGWTMARAFSADHHPAFAAVLKTINQNNAPLPAGERGILIKQTSEV